MNAREKTGYLLSRLSEGVKAIQSTEQFKAVLDCMASFHAYSWRNSILIHLQYPQASKVAGYRTWEKFGRHVKRGEKGISILAPSVYKKQEIDPITNEEVEVETTASYFFPVCVFDISQTEGNELPKIGLKAIENTHAETLEKMLGFADRCGISVEFVELANCEGISTGGKIKIQKDKNATEKVLILVHELAHELLHWDAEKRPKLTREQKEMEAEATAYVVANALGISETNSTEYLALYYKSYSLEKSLEVIHETSRKILSATRDNATADKEEDIERSA